MPRKGGNILECGGARAEETRRRAICRGWPGWPVGDQPRRPPAGGRLGEARMSRGRVIKSRVLPRAPHGEEVTAPAALVPPRPAARGFGLQGAVAPRP